MLLNLLFAPKILKIVSDKGQAKVLEKGSKTAHLKGYAA
jgi:hypothetical protein